MPGTDLFEKGQEPRCLLQAFCDDQRISLAAKLPLTGCNETPQIR